MVNGAEVEKPNPPPNSAGRHVPSLSRLVIQTTSISQAPVTEGEHSKIDVVLSGREYIQNT